MQVAFPGGSQELPAAHKNSRENVTQRLSDIRGMQSEPVIESRTAGRGHRRKHGNGSAEGPVFVDTTGRRSKAMRRVGLLLGAVCLTCAGVLAAAFTGRGTSLDPISPG